MQPFRLTIKKELTARSDRVKSVDIFPGEAPWVLVALYSGNVFIWDYSSNTMIKSFETGTNSTNPVRCAKFIVRKQFLIAGTDDMKLRVFNYNTMDKIKEWEAHTDYIRYLEVHPNRPLVLSCSDDMSIKMWDWEKDWDCVQVFEGHSHYVMMVRINPRDTNTFASASLDKSIKVWGLTAGTPHFSLDGPGSHEKGVNCVDYYPGGDKPYLLSGADDRTIKIWDYQTKACLQTLEGHAHNISSVCFHPRIPIILSASEDGTVRLWHAITYRPETTLNYGLERAWCIAVTNASNKVAIGYDEGTIVIKLGNERPVASLDTNSGKLVWARNHDIQTISLRGLNRENELVDGEHVSVSTRDLGACEVYPQSLAHNSNGSFIIVRWRWRGVFSQWIKSNSLVVQVGAALLLLLWASSECLYNESSSYPVWNDATFAIFMCIGDFVLLLFMWGLAMFVWKQSGIDFVQLLQLQGTEVEGTKCPATLVVQSATKLSIIFLLAFVVFNKSVHMAANGQLSFAYTHTIPVLLGLYFLYIIFNPWQKRKIWLSMVGRVLIAPLSPVVFRDDFIGDILTSLVRVLVPGAFSLLYVVISVYAWLCNDIRWTVSTSDRWWSHSRWCQHLVIPLLTLYPLWIRLVQCLRHSVETGQRWPHMINALKYASAIIVISFATFQPRLRRDPWWVLSLIGATVFQYSWDLTQDWGMIIFCFHRESRRGSSLLDCCLKCSISLRQKRLLGPSWLYILVMLFNLVLRFAWTLTLLPTAEEDDVKSFYATVVSHMGPIVAAAEIVRRMAWGFFRLEFEQTVVAAATVNELDRMDVETSFEGKSSQGHEKERRFQTLSEESDDASPEDWTSFLPSVVIAYIDAMSLSTRWQPKTKVRFIECVLFAGSVLCAVLLAASPIFFPAQPVQ
eukprot:gene11082-12341_t